MKSVPAALVGLIVLTVLAGCMHRPAPTDPLVTGKLIATPVLPYQNVGSLPINMIATPDGRFVISTDGGNRQSLWCIRSSDGKGVSHIDYDRSPKDLENGLYYGLAV